MTLFGPVTEGWLETQTLYVHESESSVMLFFMQMFLWLRVGWGRLKGGWKLHPFIAWINPGIDREPGPTA